MDFRKYSLKELVNNVKTKKVSAKEMTEASINNISKYDKTLNAFCAVNFDDALKQAE
ncbi:MAG: amidase, partial [Dehalococcoidia bacterium]|nr:amidase [Dehalococcoidia bacterium]